MDCKLISRTELEAWNKLPQEELAPKISECLCRQVYGMGTSDIAGIGVSVLLCWVD